MRTLWQWSALTALTLGAACSDDAGIPDARPSIDAAVPGRLALSWTIGHDGVPLTCSQIEASSVTFEIIQVGAAFGVVDSLGCASGMGTSRDLTPGLYDVRITLDGAGGMLDGPEARRNVKVEPGQEVALEPIAFDVDPHGDLQFRIADAAAGGSCAEAGQGGADIATMAIELRDGAGTCVPTTFMIAAGATAPAATYVSDCAGATHGCIAADQDIRASGVTAGAHALVITGNVATAPCWKRTTTFRVRSAGLLTTLSPIQLMRDPTVPGCSS